VDRERLSTLFDLSGRVAIVTGGTRGIGRAIAEGFVAAGAKVVVASRKAEACAETEAYLVAMGGEALGVPAHLGDLDTPALLVSSAVERFGRLDIIVNNAANALALPIGQVTAEGWEKSYAVNLRGPVFLVQEAVPQLTASPCAAVINVISSGAFMFSPNLGMYAGGKAAMMAWTRTMAAELALKGIRVNALAPGTVATDMVRNNTPDAQARMEVASHMRRIASADEMVGPAVFLASDAASYMTGQVLIVDGGLIAH